MDFKVLFLVAAFLVCSNAAPTVEEDRLYIASVLENVPEAERKQFLIHQLYKGYVMNNPNYVAVPVSEETTLRIYESFLRNYVIPGNEQLFSQVCFPSGECVDTDDPGVYP